MVKKPYLARCLAILMKVLFDVYSLLNCVNVVVVLEEGGWGGGGICKIKCG